MRKKKYTDYEKKTLRVLKMQEGDLKRLDEKTSTQQEALNRMDKRLAAMKERAKSLASDEGVELPEEHHYPVAAFYLYRTATVHVQLPAFPLLYRPECLAHPRYILPV